MPSGTPSTTRRPFTDSDDRELVAFLAVHHPSKEGRMGNAVYKLLTEQPNKWPWGKRHTWMSWRERYKNNEGRFDHHIKAFQQKNKLSRRAVPIGFGAMLVSSMEDLDDFGTEDEEEAEQPRGEKAARVDSDPDDDEEPAKVQYKPLSKITSAFKLPTSKRKRISDTNDRTSKRTRVTDDGSNGELEGRNSLGGPIDEKDDDAMDQDSQGEETLEVEQNLFYPSDEESPTTPRSHNNTHGGGTPKRLAQPSRAGGPAASTPRTQLPPQPREPVHRPHSPKNPSSSPFSTIDLDESDTESPIVPKRLRKRTVPKIVEKFDLLVERRAARKAGAAKQPEARSTGDDVTWELRELQHSTPEPGPSTPSTSKRGSVEPRGSSLRFTPRSRPGPPFSNAVDPAEKKMIEAREELSKLALRFRDQNPRSPLGSKSPDTRVNGETHPLDETTHPFDETTHPFDETTHPFDETVHSFDDFQTQTQEVHPFDEDSLAPSREVHPFDESTQEPQDSTSGGPNQRRGLEVGELNVPMRISPAPPTPRSSKRTTEAILSESLLESRDSRSRSQPPLVSPINRLRPGLLTSPRSPQNLTADEVATANGSSRRLKFPTPTTSRSALRSPLSPTDDASLLSLRRVRSGAVSPEDGRPKSTAAQELRELLENSPRARRTTGNVETQPQAHVKPPRTSERKQLTHRTRLSEPSVKPELVTPGYHLRSKSTANDDPFSPPNMKLSSPHPRADATIPDTEQESPLAPVTTSWGGLEATIKPRRVRRDVVQDRDRRDHDSEQPNTSDSARPTTVAAASTTVRRAKVAVEASVQTAIEEDVDVMDESQTYDIEHDLYDVSGTPMMDLSVRPPRRIPPPRRASSHTRQGEHERRGDGQKSSLRYREREIEGNTEDDHEQRRHSRKLSGVSFGSPIATSSPQNVRRIGHGQSYDKSERTTSNISFSSRTSLGSTTSTTSPPIEIMAGPLGLGFTPSEMDAYLGIQVACEKIAKTHGFQSDAVFRVYQEVKDLRKAEEIVIGMKRAAEKDAIERIMKVREKTERRRASERSGEGSSYWDRAGGQSWTSRRSYDVRDEEDGQEEMDHSTIYEEEEDDPDIPLRVENLSRRNKRPSTSTLRHGGGYDRAATSTTTTRTREGHRVHSREGSAEYHPPTPTRASLWERLSKSGKHPETALLGESLRASLSIPR